MKRRLQNAYDRMTMPDDCARRIEKALEQQQMLHIPGQYSKAISPVPVRRNWTAVAAMMCLVMVLLGGGTMLALRLAGRTAAEQTEAVATVETKTEEMMAWEEKTVPEVFEAVLEERTTLWFRMRDRNMTISEYSGYLAEEEGTSAFAEAFTLVDLDQDGVCELAVKFCSEDGSEVGTLLGRVEQEHVSGCFLRYGQMHDLKKDGSFSTMYNMEYGEGRLLFFDNGGFQQLVGEFPAQDKAPVQWHSLPCQRVDVVMDSYRYAKDSGLSVYPGSQFWVLEELAFGRMENDYDAFRAYMADVGAREGMVFLEEKSSFAVFDTDAPGCWMYGNFGELLGSGGKRVIWGIGYYVCDENGEYQAEIVDLPQENPKYRVDVHLPEPGSKGKQVESFDHIRDYFGKAADTSVGGEIKQITALMDSFAYAYFMGDRSALKEMLAVGSNGTPEVYSNPGEPVIRVHKGISEWTYQNVGDTCAVSLEVYEPGQTDSVSYLSMELIKEETGWKVLSYGLEK